MAKAYNVVCPQCGLEFQILKGTWLAEYKTGKKLPPNRDENVTDYCPGCNRRFSVKDKDFRKYVKEYMFID